MEGRAVKLQVSVLMSKPNTYIIQPVTYPLIQKIVAPQSWKNAAKNPNLR